MNSKYHKNKKFVCPECSKDFNKFKQLRQHMANKYGVIINTSTKTGTGENNESARDT